MKKAILFMILTVAVFFLFPRMYFMYFLGIGFIVFPMVVFIDSWQIKRNRVEADATVIKTERVQEGVADGSTFNTFTPVLRYVIADEQFERRYRTGDAWQKYADGEVITIWCHKNNYKRVLIPNDKTRLIVSLVFIGVGILILTATIVWQCYES